MDEITQLRDIVFNDVAVERGIPFGRSGQGDTFRVDVYSAIGDTAIDRPVLIPAFPGGFTAGARDEEPELAHIETNVARRGHVSALIDYSLLCAQPQ
ncbi:MAG: hypothetical protein AAGA19_11875 [Pseudomonadota bacterium]